MLLPGVEPLAPATALRHLLWQRHSCRGYHGQCLPRSLIAQILEAAQRTPSWGNVQPWHVLVTSGEATDRFRSALVAEVSRAAGEPDIAFPSSYSAVQSNRRRDAARSLFTSVGAATRSASARQTAENFRFYGAPHLAIVSVDATLGPYGVLDCGAYISAFMLVAASLGVGTIAQASLARYGAFIRSYFGLDQARHVVAGIAFGLEDASHPANGFRTDRAPLEDVVTWVDE